MTAPKTKSLKDIAAELGLGPSFACAVEFALSECVYSVHSDDDRLVESVFIKPLNRQPQAETPDAARSFKLEVHLSSTPAHAPAMGISFREVARDCFELDDAFATTITGTGGEMYWRPLLGVPQIDNLANMITRELNIGGPLATSRVVQTAALFKRKPS